MSSSFEISNHFKKKKIKVTLYLTVEDISPRWPARSHEIPEIPIPKYSERNPAAHVHAADCYVTPSLERLISNQQPITPRPSVQNHKGGD